MNQNPTAHPDEKTLEDRTELLRGDFDDPAPAGCDLQTRIKIYLDIWSSLGSQELELVEDAVAFGEKCHRDQRRKSGEPYFHHPLKVAMRSYRYFKDPVTVIGALLHDVVEDCGVRFSVLREKYGNEATDLVQALTKVKKNRNLTLKNLFALGSTDYRVFLIKFMDRLDNLDSLTFLRRKQQRRIADETYSIYAEVAQGLGMYDLSMQFRDRSFRIKAPKNYEQIRQRIISESIRRAPEREKITSSIFSTLGPEFCRRLTLEPKLPHMFININRHITDIPDSYRIEQNSILNCYTAMGILHTAFRCAPLSIRDYISNPKANGWEGLVSELIIDRTKIKLTFVTPDQIEKNRIGFLSLINDKKMHSEEYRQFLQLFLALSDEEFRLDELFRFSDVNDIQVMTPQNKIIELKGGSSVLDFAFAIHTELGLACKGGIVDGIFNSRDRVLREGEKVEIVTDKTVRPDKSWLIYLVMPNSKRALLSYLNRTNR